MTKNSQDISEGADLKPDFLEIDGQKAKNIYAYGKNPEAKTAGKNEQLTEQAGEDKSAETELENNYQNQAIINEILKISLKKIPLETVLQEIIKSLFKIPWIKVKSQGGIWLTDSRNKTLYLAAQKNLPAGLIKNCSQVKFGECVCGKAAKTGRMIISQNSSGKNHTKNNLSGASHGHYCAPIIFRKKTLGVINLYIKGGHEYKQSEAELIQLISNILANIIDRCKTREELEYSEKKYRKLIHNTRNGILIINPEGKIVFLNQAVESITGFTRKELSNADFAELLHPDDRRLVLSRFKNRIKGKRPIVNYKFRIITKSGKTKSLSVAASTMYRAGRIEGVQATVRDVSEIKQREEKIRRLHEFNQRVLNSAPVSIVALDKNGVIISANELAKQLMGKKESEILNRKLIETKNIKANRLLKAKYQNLLSGGMAFQYKNLKYKPEKSKEDFYLNIVAVPLYNNGRLDGAISMAVDNTEAVLGQKKLENLNLSLKKQIDERKKIEERIRNLSEINQKILDNAPLSLVLLDKKAKIISANEMAKKLMDTPKRPIVGRNLTETEEIKNNQKLIKLYENLLENGKPFYYDNLLYVPGGKGRTRSLNIIAVPLYNPSNKHLEGAISMALDNTEAVQAKKKLHTLNRELEHKVRKRTRELNEINKRLSHILDLKSKFVADASHELRTPLTVIRGNLDLALREARLNGAEDIPEIYSLIIDEVERMRVVLTDLTMLTNFDICSEQINAEKVSLNQLARTVLQSLSILAKQKNISLINKLPPENLFIIGDEAKLEKMLLNIIRNGIKYTESGGYVSVSLENGSKKSKIVVQDNGIGIPEHDLPNIFERFYRVDKARSRGEGGSGLGLSIAKWIVEAHRGAIAVESAEGKGSEFTISLPHNFQKNIQEHTLFQ